MDLMRESAVVSASVRPSAKGMCESSRDMFLKGSTASVMASARGADADEGGLGAMGLSLLWWSSATPSTVARRSTPSAASCASGERIASIHA